MLIKMFVTNIILSVLLLAGVSHCAVEEDGYDYSRPSIGFSDGPNSSGSQSIYTKPTEYIIASSKPKPAVVYNVKPQTSINQAFGQYPSVQQYKAPIVTKPQTLFGGSSSFGESSTSFGRPVSSLSQFGQYQSPQLSTSVQPQANFGAYQGTGQFVSGQYKAPVVPVTSKPLTNFGAFQGTGQFVSGQYKAPVSVTSKPLTNFGASQGLGQSSLTTGTGQYVSGQYKAPVVPVTSKPLNNFGAFQGTGQFVSGQYKAPVVPVTSKPLTNFGAFQGLDQSSSTTGSGQYVSGQYKAPVVPVTSKPLTNFGAFQGLDQSSSTTGTGQYVSGQYKAPVVPVTSKPLNNFGAFQGTGQFVSGQYKAPVVPVTSKPLNNFGAFQGTGQYVSGQYKAPVVLVTSKPLTNFGAFQGLDQSSSTTGTGQYVSGQYKAPVVPVTSKPLNNFGAFQGTGQYVSGQYKAPVVPVTSKPLTNFGAFQGLGQSSLTTGTGQFVSGQYKAPVSVTSKPLTNFGAFQGLGQSSLTTGTGQYVSGQYKAPVVSLTNKPQTNIGDYQGFGQSANKLSFSTGTGQYQPSVSIVAKPKPTFTGSQRFSQSNSQPSVFIAKPIKVESYKPISATVVKPTVVKPTVVKPTVVKPTVVKPTVVQPTIIKPTAIKPIIVKPQQSSSGLGSYQGFGQSKPSSINVVIIPSKGNSNVYQGFGTKTNQQPLKPLSLASSQTGQYQNVQYQKPSSILPQFQKPLTTYGSFQGSLVSRPVTSSLGNIGLSYLPPSKPLVSSTIKVQPTLKPAVSQYNFESASSTVTPALVTPVTTLTTPKPVVIAAKPQTSFSGFQGSLVKPILNTQTSFSDVQGFGQYSSKPTVVQYQKPVVYTTTKPIFQQPIVQYQKPLVPTPIKSQSNFGSFQGFGQSSYQKPAVSQTYSIPSTTVKPQLSYLPPTAQVQPVPLFASAAEKYISTPLSTTLNSIIVTPKPQAAFSGFSGQSVFPKPAINTFNTFGQQSATQYAAKPLIVTPKPQTAFSGFGQSVYQKPAVNTFNNFGQQSASRYTNTPTTFKPLTVTLKPQSAFSGFGQSVYQKPAVSTFNNLGQQSATQYASAPITVKPLTVTAKPQTAFSGLGQSVYQKPAVSSFNTFGQQSDTRFTSTPTTVKPFVASAKPQTAFGGFEQSVYQKPVIVSTTPRPQQLVVSTTFAPRPTIAPQSLTYLPPIGINLPLNAASASGAISESFFEYPSTTANQVVDVAQEQKVGRYFADLGFKSQGSELPIIANQVSSSSAQEQEVEEGIDLRSSKLTATNNEQEQTIFSENRRNKRETYSYGGYQTDYAPPTGYLSYQGNPITSQQFGGVQPNSYLGIPYQQIAEAQSSVGITDGTAVLDQQNFQAEPRSAASNAAPSQDPYNFETQYSYFSSIEDQQQQIPQNYETAASLTDAINTQMTGDAPIQDPQPLNREEQQIRQVEEKPDNNFQNLQPGSYIGPHVNKNSDHEYNVFDYDQYGKDPEDADV